MKAFVYTGGRILPENITEHPKGDDLRIAADAGYENALALGERVDLLLGDFDSLKLRDMPKEVERLQVPAEKDFTDTQLAVDTALKKGATEICIIGGLDGRLDHTLSNLAILEDLQGKGIYATITNGFNRVRFLRENSAIIPKNPYFRYISLICAEERAKGVCIDGVKYPLQNATLSRRNQYAVSNEITGNCAFVAVQKGALYVIESYDDGAEV